MNVVENSDGRWLRGSEFRSAPLAELSCMSHECDWSINWALLDHRFFLFHHLSRYYSTIADHEV